MMRSPVANYVSFAPSSHKKPSLFSVAGVFVLIFVVVSGCTVTSEKEILPQSDKRIEQTTDSIVEAFNQFLERHSIRSGAIAISYNGKLVGTAGKNRSAADPARLASLSKAITAVCTIKALESSNYTVKSSLREIMPDQLVKNSTNKAKFEAITVEQLLTHTSKLTSKHLSRQGKYITRFDREQKNWQLDNIFKYETAKGRAKKYYYANSNYLILGIVIEKLTNSDYESYCKKAVLSPLTITKAKLAPSWRILSSYGGWELSAIDYLKFVNKYYTKDWRNNFPSMGKFKPAKMKGSAEYGLGMSMRESISGTTFWHAGSLFME